MYIRTVVSIRPDKEEIYRTGIAAIGELLKNTTKSSTSTIYITTMNVFINFVISTPKDINGL